MSSAETPNAQDDMAAEWAAALEQHRTRAALQRLTDPRNYLGEAPQMVDRALALDRAFFRARALRPLLEADLDFDG